MMSSQHGTESLGGIRSANFSTSSVSRCFLSVYLNTAIGPTVYLNTAIGPTVTVFQGHIFVFTRCGSPCLSSKVW